MDVAQALTELSQLSSQIQRAVVLDESGAVLGSTFGEPASSEPLAQAARDLIAAAGELHAQEDVTRVEVELAEGAVFVLREGERTIAATTGPEPTAGLVVYDLRTCLHGIDETKPKRRRKSKESDA